MERVTYILGAGFSAPLGLPVMRNFLIKSKDMYFTDPSRYKHFEDVFKTINWMSVSKNYYDTDLFNIKEILSIIEMGDFVEGKRLKKTFAAYICDVIKYYTPSLEANPNGLPRNWAEFIFGINRLQQAFGYFVSNLLGLKFSMYESPSSGERKFHVHCLTNQNTQYAVITLNYDIILEQFCNFINTHYPNHENISFNRENKPGNWDRPLLAKLHGSADTGYVVPPTWAKGIYKRIAPVWNNAHQALLENNYIRFIGYSLPIADSYIKYLLKSAVIQSKHLKRIDVICMDYDGSTKKRYDDFIKFSDYRFANENTANYVLRLYMDQSDKIERGGSGRIETISFNRLESGHKLTCPR